MKKIILSCFLIMLTFIGKSQLSHYNSREWNPDYASTKFIDNFNGTALDSQWEVIYGYGRGDCIFMDLPAVTYSLNNGHLYLTSLFQTGNCFTDPSTGQNVCPNFIAAEVRSKNQFKHGIYEGRMKFATGRASWPAFWIFGGSDADNPFYDDYASEIDIAEYNWDKPVLSWIAKTEHVLHWWGPNGELPVDGVSKEEVSVDWSSAHTFKLVYTPYYLKFYVDGILSFERSRFYYLNESGMQKEISIEEIDESTEYYMYEGYPQHAGHIILSQQVKNGVSNPASSNTSSFDWITYKKFFLAPKISCPKIICSIDTAILDVDSDVMNITWQLTPSNLFSTTNGSGSTATITSTGISGLGTIVFSFEKDEEIFTAEETFWIGEPLMPFDISFIPTTPCLDQWMYALVKAKNPPLAGATYEWRGSHDFIPQNPQATEVHFETIDGPLPYGSWVRVKSTNVCGSSFEYSKYLWVDDCGGGIPPSPALVFTPNPSTGETVLSIESISTEMTFDETSEWELEVYSETQVLKERRTKMKGTNATIQTAGWQDGIYMVRVKYGEEILTGKLVVKNM